MLHALFLATAIVSSTTEPGAFVPPRVVVSAPTGTSIETVRGNYRRARSNCLFFAYMQDRVPGGDLDQRRKTSFLACMKDELIGAGMTVKEDSTTSSR